MCCVILSGSALSQNSSWSERGEEKIKTISEKKKLNTKKKIHSFSWSSQVSWFSRFGKVSWDVQKNLILIKVKLIFFCFYLKCVSSEKRRFKKSEFLWCTYTRGHMAQWGRSLFFHCHIYFKMRGWTTTIKILLANHIITLFSSSSHKFCHHHPAKAFRDKGNCYSQMQTHVK